MHDVIQGMSGEIFENARGKKRNLGIREADSTFGRLQADDVEESKEWYADQQRIILLASGDERGNNGDERYLTH